MTTHHTRGVRRVPASLLITTATLLLLASCTATPDNTGATSTPDAPPTAKPVQPVDRSIAIDGLFDDWDGLPSIAAAKRTDSIDAPNPLPLKQIWTTSDSRWVYFLLDLGIEMNLQGLSETITLQLDADGDRETGITLSDSAGGLDGVDFTIRFSPLGERNRTEGVSAQCHESGLPSAEINPYRFEATFAPTVASRYFELRLKRDALVPEAAVRPFTGSAFVGRLVVTDKTHRTIASTNAFYAPLVARQSEGSSNALAADALPTCPPNATRLITWNVELGNIFKNPEPFARILKALDPDIICLQETGRGESAHTLTQWLNDNLRSKTGWEVSMLPGQETAVATRLSAAPVSPAFAPDERGRYPVRTASMLVAAANRRVLVTSTHLKCCGNARDENDKKRVTEANAIRRLIRKMQYNHAPSAIIVAGDLNLVGSSNPLEIIKFQNDLNGTDLYVADPHVLGDTTNITWRDPDQHFLPGRLDYVVLSDSVLTVVNEFVFDTASLGPSVRPACNLYEDDSARTTDHLPVVVDFK